MAVVPRTEPLRLTRNLQAVPPPVVDDFSIRAAKVVDSILRFRNLEEYDY